MISYALSETPDGAQLSIEMRDSGQFVQVAALELPGEDPPDVASRVRWESAHRRRESALSLAVAGRLIEIQGGSFLISRGNPGSPSWWCRFRGVRASRTQCRDAQCSVQLLPDPQ